MVHKPATLMLMAMRIARTFIVALGLFASLWPGVAAARCGSGNPPSYDDIDAVMLAQNYTNGQGPTSYRRRVASFPKSTFWVFFWNDGREELPTVYSQFDLKGSVGTFTLSASLGDARTVLRRHSFFTLNPPDDLVTDTLQTVLYVKRCAVITTIRSYVAHQEDEDIATRALFDDLRSLILSAKATRTAPTAKDFDQTLLFNP